MDAVSIRERLLSKKYILANTVSLFLDFYVTKFIIKLNLSISVGNSSTLPSTSEGLSHMSATGLKASSTGAPAPRATLIDPVI